MRCPSRLASVARRRSRSVNLLLGVNAAYRRLDRHLQTDICPQFSPVEAVTLRGFSLVFTVIDYRSFHSPQRGGPPCSRREYRENRVLDRERAVFAVRCRMLSHNHPAPLWKRSTCLHMAAQLRHALSCSAEQRPTLMSTYKNFDATQPPLSSFLSLRSR